MIRQIKKTIKHSKTSKITISKPKVTMIDLTKIPTSSSKCDLKQRRAERAMRRNSLNSVSPNNSTLLKLSAVENMWKDMKNGKSPEVKNNNQDQILKLTQTANILLKNLQDNLSGNKPSNAKPNKRVRKTSGALTIIKNKY